MKTLKQKPGSILLLWVLFPGLLFFSSSSYSIEITPLFGYRDGGDVIDISTSQKHTVTISNTYGFLISTPDERGKTFELYYSHQSSDIKSINITLPPASVSNIPLSINYLHFGGTAPISDEKKFNTFISGGLGVTYLSPDLDGLNSELRTSFSVGIGLKWPVSQNVALRLETRGLVTLFNTNSTLFCDGGCSLTANGNLFIQGEVFAGLAIRF